MLVGCAADRAVLRAAGPSDTAVPPAAGRVRTRRTANGPAVRRGQAWRSRTCARAPMFPPRWCACLPVGRSCEDLDWPSGPCRGRPHRQDGPGQRQTQLVSRRPVHATGLTLGAWADVATRLQAPLSAGPTQGSGLRADPQPRAAWEPCCVPPPTGDLRPAQAGWGGHPSPLHSRPRRPPGQTPSLCSPPFSLALKPPRI